MNFPSVLWKNTVFLWLVFETWFPGAQTSKLSKYKVLWGETRISYHFFWRCSIKNVGVLMLFIVTFERLTVNPEWETCFLPQLWKVSGREPCFRDQLDGDAALSLWPRRAAEYGWSWGGGGAQATPTTASPVVCPGPLRLLWKPCAYLLLKGRRTWDWETSGLIYFLVTSAVVKEIPGESLIWYSLTSRN